MHIWFAKKFNASREFLIEVQKISIQRENKWRDYVKITQVLKLKHFNDNNVCHKVNFTRFWVDMIHV